MNCLSNGINILAGDDHVPERFGPKDTDPDRKDARFTFHTRCAVQSATADLVVEILCLQGFRDTDSLTDAQTHSLTDGHIRKHYASDTECFRWPRQSLIHSSSGVTEIFQVYFAFPSVQFLNGCADPGRLGQWSLLSLSPHCRKHGKRWGSRGTWHPNCDSGEAMRPQLWSTALAFELCRVSTLCKYQCDVTGILFLHLHKFCL